MRFPTSESGPQLAAPADANEPRNSGGAKNEEYRQDDRKFNDRGRS